MGNEATKKQIRNFLEKAIEEARNPDPRIKLKRERLQKANKVIKRFGL